MWALELSLDRHPGERREGSASSGVEPVDGLQEGEAGDLDEVLGGFTRLGNRQATARANPSQAFISSERRRWSRDEA
jgi:hypothetical protein